jgi:hypothetical protein
MTTRTRSGRRASLACALALVLAAGLPAAASAATTTAELRVLTPTKVLDPGTHYIVDDTVTVPTTPQADCFGPPGGSGAEFSYDAPNALSLLATAARTSGKVRPLALTDQFGFGLGICGIGGQEAVQGESFWYLKANHQESTLGADQLAISSGDEILFYLSPDNFPNPNPAELELEVPPRVEAGESFTVRVLQHACVTDQVTFEVTCTSGPAAGVTVSTGGQSVGSGADGTAQLVTSPPPLQTSGDPAKPSRLRLSATRGTDIPAEELRICVAERLDDCPRRLGERIVGSPGGDRIKATAGSDAIRARGGDDRVDLRKGGVDRVDCGSGDDRVLVARSDDDDRIARNCERVGGR